MLRQEVSEGGSFFLSPAADRSSHSKTSNKKLRSLDQISARAWDTTWPVEAIMQRNFAVFGGEFLLSCNVESLRGFFSGFFALPIEMWGGFLAGYRDLPYNYAHEDWQSRLAFGILFTTKIPLKVSASLIALLGDYWGRYGTVVKQAVTPLFGKPEGYKYGSREMLISTGDEGAKRNARDMIRESKSRLEKEKEEKKKERSSDSGDDGDAIPRNLLH
jgi:lycopene beta-cyclase